MSKMKRKWLKVIEREETGTPLEDATQDLNQETDPDLLKSDQRVDDPLPESGNSLHPDDRNDLADAQNQPSVSGHLAAFKVQPSPYPVLESNRVETNLSIHQSRTEIDKHP